MSSKIRKHQTSFEFQGTCSLTTDLSSVAKLSFAGVENYSKKESGCENIAKAYKLFAEPGYLHELKGTLQVLP